MTRSSARLARIEPGRVCIIKPSSLGDVIHALPILSALRRRWPSAHLAWVVSRPFREVLQDHPDLDELIVFSRGQEMAGLLRCLARGRYNLTIDLQGLLRSALMTAATLAKVRVGVANAREGARWFYTHRVVALDSAFTPWIACSGSPPLSVPRHSSRVFTCRSLKSIGDGRRQTLAAVPRPCVILNLGARWPTKRWPPHHFAAIARRAVSEFGAGLVAVGTAEDRPMVNALAAHLAPLPFIDLCGQTRLPQLAALSLEAEMVISNDTGPLHLAAAAGARVLGIYTCTDPKLTGPIGPRVATVQSHVWCAPSFHKSCNRLECMAELTPDRVWPHVKDQLEAALTPTYHLPSHGSWPG